MAVAVAVDASMEEAKKSSVCVCNNWIVWRMKLCGRGSVFRIRQLCFAAGTPFGVAARCVVRSLCQRVTCKRWLWAIGREAVLKRTESLFRYAVADGDRGHVASSSSSGSVG